MPRQEKWVATEDRGILHQLLFGKLNDPTRRNQFKTTPCTKFQVSNGMGPSKKPPRKTYRGSQKEKEGTYS